MRWFVLVTLIATPAAADEISGDWCSEMGHHVRIEGATIISPGGQETFGSYGRHAFEYVIPEGEADAGAWVLMRQQSEERVIVTYDGENPQPWHRCQPVS